jgi:hypothetical protein
MIKIYEAAGEPWMYIWCCLTYNKAIYDVTLAVGEVLFWEVSTSLFGTGTLLSFADFLVGTGYDTF